MIIMACVYFGLNCFLWSLIDLFYSLISHFQSIQQKQQQIIIILLILKIFITRLV